MKETDGPITIIYSLIVAIFAIAISIQMYVTFHRVNQFLAGERALVIQDGIVTVEDLR